MRLPRILAWTVSALLVSGVAAQEDPLETLRKFTAPEAPPAYLSLDANDTAVELFLQGSWKSYWGDYLGFGSSAGVNGFNHTPWSNSVDLLVSLWIQRHWFFMANLSDGLTFQTFSIGYANADGPGLNKLALGNAGIDFPSYDYVTIGKSTPGVPGVAVEWSGEKSRHQAVLRLLNRNTVTQYFRGTAPLLNSQAAPNSFISGQFFQLPYDRLAAIRVWLQVAGGGYRQAVAADFLYIDLNSGRFGLAQAAAGQVAANWDKGADSAAVSFPSLATENQIDAAAAVPFDPSAGSAFETLVSSNLRTFYGYSGSDVSANWPSLSNLGLTMTLDGQEALLVHRPGSFSVFEDYSWYARPQGLTPIAVQLDSGHDPSFIVAYQSNFIHLGYVGATGVVARYPFLASAYASRKALYLPGFQAQSGQWLAWQGTGAASSSASITLDQDALPQSVQVTRNGLPETGFTYVEGSRTLQFAVPIQSADNITVSYDLVARGGGTRTIQFAQGNEWKPDDATTVKAAFGLDWPIEASAAGSNGTDVGRLMTGFTVQYQKPEDKLSWSIGAGGSLAYPNANGSHLLMDFSTSLLKVVLGAGMLVPSAVPSYPGSLAVGGRGKLYYQKFNNGTSLAAWDAGPSATYPYASGNPTGPSLAASSASDSFSGTVAVADMDIPAPTNSWVAFDIRLTSDQRVALAKTGAIWLRLRSSLSQSANFYLQAGRLAEDIDGDGTIETGSAGSNGFAFHDTANATTMTAGSDYANAAGALLSEDSDGNGILLTQDQNPFNYAFSSTNYWSTPLRIPITDADRVKLQGANALRLIVVNMSGVQNTGSVVVGDIQFDLPGAIVTSAAAQAQASVETDVAKQVSLAGAFPDSQASGSSAFQGRLDWTAGADVQAKQLLNATSLYDSQYVRVYLLRAPPSVSNLQLALTDADGNTVTSPTFSLPNANAWYKAEFDTVGGSFKLTDQSGGVAAAGSSIVFGHPHDFVAVTVVVKSPGSTGSLYYSCISTSQGLPKIDGSATGKLDWAYPKAILAAEGFTFLNNFRTTNQITYDANTRLASYAGLDLPTGSSLDYRGGLGATVCYVDLNLATKIVLESSGYGGQASYSATVPSGVASPVTLTDAFSSDIGTGAVGVAKSSSLSLQFPNVFSLSLNGGDGQSNGQLEQKYHAGVGVGSTNSLSGNLSLDIDQNMSNVVDQDQWNQSSLFDKLGRAYGWYLPMDDAALLNRGVKLNLDGSAAYQKVGFTLGGAYQSTTTPANSPNQSLQLDMKSALTFGDAGDGSTLSFAYLRRTILGNAWQGDGIGDDLGIGLGRTFAFRPSWLSLPWYEIFADSGYFQDGSQYYPSAVLRPQFQISYARPMSSGAEGLYVPVKTDLGVARLLQRLGTLIGDNFLAYATLTWNTQNQFGALGRQPSFGFYDSDQLSYQLSVGALLDQQAVAQFQIAPSFSVALFGLALSDAKSWRERSASSVGLVDLAPPNQLSLSDSFVYRSGAQGVAANTTKLVLSWYVDLPDLKYDFMGKKSKSNSFLENLESLAVSFYYPAGSALSATLNTYTLTDLFGFSQLSDASQGFTAVFQHKSYLILPGLAYLSAQLSAGYQIPVSGPAALLVQLYIEARVVF